jgi:hypothetical protein
MMKFLISLLIALETADGVLTYTAVGKDLVREANPRIQSFVGTGDFLLMKICGALLSALLLWLVYKRFPKLSLVSTSCILAFYTLVNTWNLSILLRFGIL